LPISDVLTALQTGLLDVIVTPPSAALLLQWYTKLDYISTTPAAYTLGLLALDSRAFERLSEADREVVATVFTETYQRLDQINRTDNEEAEEALLANGIEMVEVNKDDIPYWRSIADQANQENWANDAVNPELYNELKKALQEYRDAGGQPEPVADASE